MKQNQAIIDNVSDKKVTKIIDGDSFQVTDAKGEIQTVHLNKVDAPEREQPFGRESTKYLKKILLNKVISFSEKNEIFIEGKNLNMHLLKKGYVWLAPGELALDEMTATELTRDQNSFQLQFAYEEAQTEAMNNLRGIWQLEHELRVPPWVWREQSTRQSASRMPQMNAIQHKAMLQQRKREVQMKQQRDEHRKKQQEKMAQLQRQHFLKKDTMTNPKKQSDDDQ